FAEEINLGHRERGFHRPATGRTGQAIAQLERVVAGGQQGAVTDLGVARLVPGDAREVVLGLKILEPNVPDERAERLDGIDFVALRANEPQAKGFVGIFWEPLLSVGGVVVTGVLESVEARVAQWHSAALERLARATQRRRRPGGLVLATDAANRGEKPLQMPPPRCQLALICPAFDVSRDCGVGPGEHRFV